jgi:shikimate dehydrogenase
MIVGARRGAAVLGSPVAHSLSPVLHQAAYDALGLDDWRYRAVECTEDQLADTLRALEAEGLAGVSLTMPLKRAVLPLLARVERLASDVGAANTVLFGGVDGEWWGANTDVPGMVTALRGAGVSRPRAVSVLGGGATAASAVAAVAELGVRATTVFARRPDAARDLVAAGTSFGVDVDVRGWAEAAGALDADLVVSTVPAGAADELATAVPGSPRALFDVVYAPWPTPLAAAWAAKGGLVVGGLALLVAQAAEQVRLMTGLEPPIARMQAAGEAALAAR